MAFRPRHPANTGGFIKTLIRVLRCVGHFNSKLLLDKVTGTCLWQLWLVAPCRHNSIRGALLLFAPDKPWGHVAHMQRWHHGVLTMQQQHLHLRQHILVQSLHHSHTTAWSCADG
jgi:hypothetical protein